MSTTSPSWRRVCGLDLRKRHARDLVICTPWFIAISRVGRFVMPRSGGTVQDSSRFAVKRYRYRGAQDPDPMDEFDDSGFTHTSRREYMWRAGCSGSLHVRFGGRAVETQSTKADQGAAARPLHLPGRRIGANRNAGWTRREIGLRRMQFL